jgi:hypothetical protein
MESDVLGPGTLSLSVPEFLGAVLPVQFYEARRAHPENAPYAALLLAVLEDAIRLFQGRRWIGKPASEGNPQARAHGRVRAYDEARDWLFDEESTKPVSFIWLCEALGIDPSYLRAGLNEWRSRIPRRSYPDRRSGPTPLRPRYRRRVSGGHKITATGGGIGA